MPRCSSCARVVSAQLDTRAVAVPRDRSQARNGTVSSHSRMLAREYSVSRRDTEYSRANIRLCDDTVPFLAWLRSRGTATALVSNCADTTRAQLEHLGIIPLVDAVVLSCEVGSMKPYPEIYVTALEELGVAAVDAVFIDDQPTFCVGAEAMGIRPIQIARHEVNGYDSRWNFPVVHSLFEVQSLLAVSRDTQ